jgi:hypothetical protein
MRKYIALLAALCACTIFAFADESSSLQGLRILPVYLSELANLNDYNVFANGGWDGNWYIGYNVCWMEALPAAPVSVYRKAYIGVKIGRAKTHAVAGKPQWEKEPIPGSIYVSLSSTPAWKGDAKYFLADSRELPVEADPENAQTGVGEARWFWAEVPVTAVSTTTLNYVAVFSPSEYFVSTASAPIIAAGWGSQKVNTWMNTDVRGYAPMRAADSLKTPITVFEPAIAIKLVPALGTEKNIKVLIDHIAEGRAKTADKVFVADIAGDAIERVWLETSVDGKHWEKQGRPVYSAPYMLTLRSGLLPDGKIMVRVAASDVWENTGYSAPTEILISRQEPVKK